MESAPPRLTDGREMSRAGYGIGMLGGGGVEGRLRLGGDSSRKRGVELVGFQSRPAEACRICCWAAVLESRMRKGDCC